MESDDNNYLMTTSPTTVSSQLPDTNVSPPQAPPAPASTPTINSNPLTLSIPTAVLLPNLPTIPIFHLQQPTSDMLKSMGDDSTTKISQDNNIWPSNQSSASRPVSRYSLTNRRECKVSVFELLYFSFIYICMIQFCFVDIVEHK